MNKPYRRLQMSKKKTEPKLALKKNTSIDYVVWDTNNYYVKTDIVLGYSTQRDLTAGGLKII